MLSRKSWILGLIVGGGILTGCVSTKDSVNAESIIASYDSGVSPYEELGEITSPYSLPGDEAFSQFPPTRPATGNKVMVVDLNIPAWAAYDAQGELVKTGKASGGKNYCPDLHRGCKTITGTYSIYSKKGPDCKSSRFPLETHGGAPMPYCMHFHKGYALHGAHDVPNYNASHGCVRLIPSSAQWLSQNFVEIGTTVIILPYKNK